MPAQLDFKYFRYLQKKKKSVPSRDAPTIEISLNSDFLSHLEL